MLYLPPHRRLGSDVLIIKGEYNEFEKYIDSMITGNRAKKISGLIASVRSPKTFLKVNRNGSNFFMRLIRHGKLDDAKAIINFLQSKGVNIADYVNIVNDAGLSALTSAVSLEAVMYLVSLGAKLSDDRDISGLEPEEISTLISDYLLDLRIGIWGRKKFCD